MSFSVQSLLKKMLKEDPQERIDLESILSDPFFSNREDYPSSDSGFNTYSHISSQTNQRETELHVVAKNNLKFSAINLIKAGADVNAKCSQLETPLHKAVQEGHKTMVKILIRNGASINEKNMHNETVLHVAVKNNDAELVKLFMNCDLMKIHPLFQNL